MMFCQSLTSIILSAATLSSVIAQQFSDVPNPVNYPGISDGCFNALNTTTSCPGFLLDVAIDNPILDDEQLTALCAPDCQSSLQSVRDSVAQSCTGSNDTISYQGSTVAATFMADTLLYTYALSCRKDSSSGAYCDQLFAEWANETALTKAQNCSDCMLGADQIQLNSPFGYNPEFAADFQSLTSSCSASQYSWTTPTSSISLTPTGTSSVDPATTSRACAGTYTVQSGDDCFSVSHSQKVATFAMLDLNVLDVFCKDPLAVGSDLCLPPTCSTYTIQANDTCESILQSNSGISFAQLESWNPNINGDCSNLDNFRGYDICLSSPSGGISDPAITSDVAVSTAVTPVAKPTNAPDESNSNCGKWYTIQDGDYCDSVSVNLGISLKDFYFLNPEINDKCTNLLLGLAYCVEAVGDIRTYSGYSTSAAFTLPPQTTQTPTPASSSSSTHVSPTIAPESMLPRASGTIADCLTYRNAVDLSQESAVNVTSNDCSYIAVTYQVTEKNLTTWNPSLDPSNCALQTGYSYCVQQTNATYDQPTYSQPAIFCDKAYGDIVDGTDEKCACFFNVYGYDNDTETCQNVADYAGVDVSDLTTWNTWLQGSDCTAALFSNTDDNSIRPVCIGTNSTIVQPTPTTTTTSPSSSPTTTGPALPKRSGFISSCTKFYDIQDGDGCTSIESQFGITFGQFYNWNPAIGGDCRGLWLGYSYCVAAPGINSAEPAAPTRTGTLPDTQCKQYYTVQDGDGCYSIEQEFGITQEQLYNWNKDIGSGCEDLELGYSLCVKA